MFLFLLTVSPAVGAMQVLEPRGRLAVIERVDPVRKRRRAVARTFGINEFSEFVLLAQDPFAIA